MNYTTNKKLRIFVKKTPFDKGSPNPIQSLCKNTKFNFHENELEVYYEFINSWMNEYLSLIYLLINFFFFGKDLKILMSNKKKLESRVNYEQKMYQHPHCMLKRLYD